jgi:hypothetical protein
VAQVRIPKCLTRRFEQVTGLAEARARLAAVRGTMPQTIEVVIRHEVTRTTRSRWNGFREYPRDRLRHRARARSQRQDPRTV